VLGVRNDPRFGPRWALFAFVVTEVITRAVTYVLRLRGAGPDGGLIVNGVHVHHVNFGLAILIVLTFAWLARGSRSQASPMPLWQPIAFGIGWSLVIDEHAMILFLEDVYWTDRGEESLVPLAIFAIVLAWMSFRPIRENKEVPLKD